MSEEGPPLSKDSPTARGGTLSPGPSLADLRALGYFLLPIPPRAKKAPPKGWVGQVAPYPILEGANIAIGTRGELAILVTNDDDATTWATDRFGPPNVRSKRGGHWYFRAHEGQTNEGNRLTSVGMMELNVKNRYALIPPSVHPSGVPYLWVCPLPPSKDLPEAPDLRDRWHPRGTHHAELLRMSAAKAHDGADAETISSELKCWRDGHLADPLAHPDKELRQLAESGAAKFHPEGSQKGRRDAVPPRSQATLLAGIGKAEARLFHDDAGELFGTITVNGHEETHRLRSTGFRRWLTGRYFAEHQSAPTNEAVTQARTVLEYEAQFNGPCLPVFLRVAEQDGELWIDLGDTEYHSVRVTPSGWSVEAKAPVRFVRGRTCLPFPVPERGGDLTELLPYLRAGSTSDPHFVLSVAWVLGAFHPRGPYPVLSVNGEQGSGKSFGSRVLRALTDPSALPLRSAPKEERDLCVAANGNRVVGFDNLSVLPTWFSDAICRLSTGGGFGTRQLYTDYEETTFSGTRPVLLNGIPVLTDAGDLRDRALLAAWPVLPKGSRRRERALVATFQKDLPRLLGAVFDALVAALRHSDVVDGDGEFRMADFAAWIIAAEKGGALPWPIGTFAKVYSEHLRGADEEAVGENPLAVLVVKVAEAGGWGGTSTALLDHLAALHTPPFEGERRPHWWPRSPRTLGNCLRRLAPSLRSLGVSVEFKREGKARTRVVAITPCAPDIQRTLEPSTPEIRRPGPSATSALSAADDGVGLGSLSPGSAPSAFHQADPEAAKADGGDVALRPPVLLMGADVADRAREEARPPQGGLPHAERCIAPAHAVEAALGVIAQGSQTGEPWDELSYLGGMERRGFSPERALAALSQLVASGMVNREGQGAFRSAVVLLALEDEPGACDILTNGRAVRRRDGAIVHRFPLARHTAGKVAP